MELDPKIIAFIVGLLITNIASLVGGIFALVGIYVAIKVQIARLEVKVEKIETDINNLGAIYRTKLNEVRQT